MLETFLVTSRETLEASLVVGIVLAYLTKAEKSEYKKSVYYGIGFGILASIAIAILFTFFTDGFEGRMEELFEGITMLFGAFLLTTLILWMAKQANVTQSLHRKVDHHLKKSHPSLTKWGIFLLIAIAIIREGVETVIFLNAVYYSTGLSYISGSIGIASSILIGYLFFSQTKRINMKNLFMVSSFLLILFAAGLTAHGVHELQEASILPDIMSPLWDLNPPVNENGSYPPLHEKGIIGSFLKGLFGYNGDPGLLEVLAYIAYFIIVWQLWRIFSSNKATA